MITNTIDKENNVRIETEFTRFFEYNGERNCGYSFPCDEQGNIEFDRMQPAGIENARRALAGELAHHVDLGVKTYSRRFRLCHCGSLKDSYTLEDARGIPVGRCCSACESKLRAKYRPSIFEDSGYQCEDCDIEPDEW